MNKINVAVSSSDGYPGRAVHFATAPRAVIRGSLAPIWVVSS